MLVEVPDCIPITVCEIKYVEISSYVCMYSLYLVLSNTMFPIIPICSTMFSYLSDARIALFPFTGSYASLELPHPTRPGPDGQGPETHGPDREGPSLINKFFR